MRHLGIEGVGYLGTLDFSFSVALGNDWAAGFAPHVPVSDENAPVPDRSRPLHSKKCRLADAEI